MSKQKKRNKAKETMVAALSEGKASLKEAEKEKATKSAEESTKDLLKALSKRGDEEAITEEALNTSIHVEGLEILISFISGSTVDEIKEKLITYCLLCAIDKTVSESYLKSLPAEVTSCKLWAMNAQTHMVCGAIGALILSNKEEDMSPAIARVKAKWVSANGGFSDAFTAKKVLKSSATNHSQEMLIICASVFVTDSRDRIKRCLSANVPGLGFRVSSSSLGILVNLTQTLSSRIAESFFSLFRDKVTGLATKYYNLGFNIALLVSGLIALTAAWNVKKITSEGGKASLLYEIARIIFEILRKLIVICFASEGDFILILITATISYITYAKMKAKPEVTAGMTSASDAELLDDFLEDVLEDDEARRRRRLSKERIEDREINIDSSTIESKEERDKRAGRVVNRKKKKKYAKKGGVTSTAFDYSAAPKGNTSTKTY